MGDNELGALYAERAEIEKRLSQLNATIGLAQRDRTDDECVALMCQYITDDKALSQCIERHLKRRRKEELKEEKRLANGVTYIYGLYDNGRLVYVGISKNLPQRIKDHRKTDKVFDDVKVLAEHSDRFFALREENALIRKLKPKYNKEVY
ncbi:hypothetical protein [Synechococcus phage S-N03]|uniref:GIY-YIG domain-containing protein n=1 Tax=Synechococcus phage S-N03 TaxID=2718943 RepID=A0A6G8R5G5_9CAUD|nr:hypothetical protein PQC09_gp022 [Synechococcus phage S-N03]QIN96657.1 hypothetical protein [Synechococcus phage S-N03]